MAINMRRSAIHKLNTWKSQPGHKPLIVKGARQVGKPFLLHIFGKEAFPHYHYMNFEKQPEIHPLFEKSLDPRHIISGLEFALKRTININAWHL